MDAHKPRKAPWVRDRATGFYRWGAVLALAVALIGFFLTYFEPLARGTFAGPRWAHLHGALLFGWLVLVVIQSRLLSHHRKLGWIALALAPAMAASTIAVGVAATRRDIAEGFPIGMAGTVTSPLIFCALVAGAIALRKDPQWHKRLIFLATVAILWPAWFRWRHFLPFIPRPDIWLGLVAAQMPIVIAMVRDQLRFGAVHPAYWLVGTAMIAEQAFEAWAFGGPLWTGFGLWLYGVFA